jgi:Ala-tRNA(Pro) deacylase
VVVGRHAGREGTVTPRSLVDFLRQARIPYTMFHHRSAFTAQEEAQVSHVPGRSWAKVVVCFADRQPILAVLPAHTKIDLEELRALAGTSTLRLAREEELAELYPDCETGAMPPFGSLYLQRVFTDRSLVGEPEMVFNAGTHTDAFRMHWGDFADVARPIVGTFAHPATAASAQADRPLKSVRPSSPRLQRVPPKL